MFKSLRRGTVLSFTLSLLASAGAAGMYPYTTPSTKAAPVVSSTAAMSAGLALRQDAKLGRILTDDQGRTLYLFTKDTPGVSNCEGQCAVNWPPFTASQLPSLPEGVTGTLSLVKRKDGSQQVALDGMPLYTWAKDQKPGDASGEGVGGVWYAVNPGPTLTEHAAGDLGKVLAGPGGLTLYVYTEDAPGVSNCEGQCASAWPPLLVAYQPKVAAEYKGRVGVTRRKDGSLQVTFDKKPLYFWVKDQKPGDATGQNVGGVWSVVRP